MIRVTIYSLTLPPSPMLYRDFRRRWDATDWAAWARKTLPCHISIVNLDN